MAVYRATRTSAFDATQYRIDIVPYDANIGDAVTTLDEGCIVDIGDLEYGFDDVLPYGLAGPATWSVTLNFSRLPSALQTRLRNKVSGSARNLFMLWSDYGTGTFTLLFAGIVDNVESAEYEPNEYGEYEATYDCIDAAYWTLLSTAGSALDSSTFHDDYDVAALQQYVYDYRSPGDAQLAYNTNYNKRIVQVRACNFDSIAADLSFAISSRAEALATRSANTDVNKIWTAFDYNSNLADVINTGARFYHASYAEPRAQSTAVTSSNTYLPTALVRLDDNEVIGGWYVANDEFSIAQAQSLKDVFSDLCETFCIKMFWTPEYVTDAGGDYIRWNVVVGTWFGNGAAGTTTAATIDLDADTVSTGTVSEGAGVIGKAETRVSLDGEEDKNVTEFVVTSARSRAERSINVEPIVHNMPTYHPKRKALDGLLSSGRALFESEGFGQTNILLRNYETGSRVAFEKVYEDVRVAVRATSGGGTVTTWYDANHTYQLEGNAENQQRLWLTAVQSESCLPYAIAKAAYGAFSDEFQATVDVTYRLGSTYSIGAVGYVHELTGDVATTFTQIQWAKACVTRVVMSPGEHTCTVSYFIPGV